MTVEVPYLRWGQPLPQDSEFRKLGTFLPATPPSDVVWQNGWHEEIQRIKKVYIVRDFYDWFDHGSGF